MKRRITDINTSAYLAVKTTLLAVAIVILWGCVSPPQLPIQYATMNLIERGAVTAEDVQARVNRVRHLVDDGLTLTELGERVRGVVGYTKLEPSDRLLVDAILGDVAHGLDIGFGVPIDDQQREAIHEALDWIEQAAAYY